MTGRQHPEVQVGGSIVGLDFQGRAVVGDRFVKLSAGGQGEAQFVVGLHVVGLDFQGPEVMGDGLVERSAGGQNQAEIEVGQVTIGIPMSVARIKRFGTGIHPALPPAQHGQRGQEQQAAPSCPTIFPQPLAR